MVWYRPDAPCCMTTDNIMRIVQIQNDNGSYKDADDVRYNIISEENDDTRIATELTVHEAESLEQYLTDNGLTEII